MESAVEKRFADRLLNAEATTNNNRLHKFVECYKNLRYNFDKVRVIDSALKNGKVFAYDTISFGSGNNYCLEYTRDNFSRIGFDGNIISVRHFASNDNTQAFVKTLDVELDVNNDSVVKYVDYNYSFGGKKIYECTYAESYLLKNATEYIAESYCAMSLYLHEFEKNVKALGIS